MRRVRVLFATVAAVLLLVLVMVGGTVALSLSGLTPLAPVDHPRLHTAHDGFVSTWWIAADDALAVFDCGADDAGSGLIASLAEAGHRPGDVTHVFLTHGHGDHTGACSAFSGATVFAGAPDVLLAEGRRVADGPLTRWIPPSPTGLDVDEELLGDTAIPLGGLTVYAFSLPGHTGGSMAYLVDGVLLLGDSAMHGAGGAVTPALWVFTDDPDTNLEALTALPDRIRQLGLTVDVLAFSHAGPRPGDAQALQTLGEP